MTDETETDKDEDETDKDEDETVFIVVCHDRHVDDAITVHGTRESADAEIENFKKHYADHPFSDGSTYAWQERTPRRSGFAGEMPTWIRFVETDFDEGPHAYIEEKEVL